MKIEVSNGEVLDKISILEIKLNRMKDEERRKHVLNELQLLVESAADAGLNEWFTKKDEYRELLQANQALWLIEDRLRYKENKQEFDDEFVELARSVYIVNDQRADIKRRINEQSNSLLVEEKEYTTKYEPNCRETLDESSTD